MANLLKVEPAKSKDGAAWVKVTMSGQCVFLTEAEAKGFADGVMACIEQARQMKHPEARDA